MSLTKVFIAVPGITGYKAEESLDISKRVDGMYYKGEKGMTPIAYVYKLESKTIVSALMDKHLQEEKELKDRQYKELMKLRNEHGL